ncbi:MAG: SAF domain-containing protein, partial [Oscillospiraceae bacterium]
MTKLFKSKAFLGIICLVLAAAIAFLLLPRFYASQSATVDVVRVKQDVPAGTVITSDMLTTAEAGAYGLPEKVVTSEAEAVGKVAAERLYAGEMLWQERLMSKEDYLSSQDARTKGLSAGLSLVTLELPSASSGLAGVLRSGNTVDVYECAANADTSYSISKCLSSMYVYNVLNSNLQSLNDLESRQASASPDDK